MSAKRLSFVVAIASAGVFQGEACAQFTRQAAANSAPTVVGADSLQEVRQFVQGFYDWYVPKTLAPHSFPAEYYVLSKADQYLDSDLASALRADSVAEEAGPMTATRQTLDADPFLGSQDPCGPYEVIGVSRRGDTFRASMRACRSTGGPVVEVRAIRGLFRITNMLYGSEGDLKSWLCQWAKADLRPEKRPAKC